MQNRDKGQMNASPHRLRRGGVSEEKLGGLRINHPKLASRRKRKCVRGRGQFKHRAGVERLKICCPWEESKNAF